MLQVILILLLFAHQATCSSSMLMNVSIDDSSPDPLTGARITYGFLNQVTTAGTGWNVGQNCSTCLAQPDPSQTFDRTWHDASTQVVGDNIPFASVSFTGVAIYVVGIIVSSTPETNRSLNNSRIFFQVDGEDAGSFLFDALISTEVVYSYNTTFFAKEDLPDGLHNVTLMCGTGDPSIDSVCLLDRFIYTTPVNSSNPSSTSSSTDDLDNSQPTITSTNPLPSASTPTSNPTATVSTAVIVGAVLGSTLSLLCLAGLYFFRRRYNRRRLSAPPQDVEVRSVAPSMIPYSVHHDSQYFAESVGDADPQAVNSELPSYADVAGDTTQSGSTLSAGTSSEYLPNRKARRW
ncbi:hypothetical protein SCHPADRAFT_697871 [Schizopora paradoxa]|uniref:Mid2 domain-containing protein n=1 Tax=Schizopora paradoxa TaxID=27342 RepID=A0A0H2R2Z3_9AGAM|nr:hypothetical protein SCHPADRAFT_697871 [Schizopora paradoxa]